MKFLQFFFFLRNHGNFVYSMKDVLSEAEKRFGYLGNIPVLVQQKNNREIDFNTITSAYETIEKIYCKVLGGK